MQRIKRRLLVAVTSVVIIILAGVAGFWALSRGNDIATQPIAAGDNSSFVIQDDGSLWGCA